MFQTRLRELRELSGYKSQQAFADAFGVAQSTVGGWESGKREPNYETTIRLAAFFDVPIGRLLDAEKPDEYSNRFRSNLSMVLAQLRDSLAGDEDCMSDYYELDAFVNSTYPLSLAEACEFADRVGESVSYLLQDNSDDCCQKRQKNLGTDESAPRDAQEEKLIGLVKKMDSAQQCLLLEILNRVTVQNQETPAFDQESTGETVPVFECRD